MTPSGGDRQCRAVALISTTICGRQFYDAKVASVVRFELRLARALIPSVNDSKVTSDKTPCQMCMDPASPRSTLGFQ